MDTLMEHWKELYKQKYKHISFKGIHDDPNYVVSLGKLKFKLQKVELPELLKENNKDSQLIDPAPSEVTHPKKVSHEDIFDDDSFKHFLVIGRQYSGKSTLCEKIASDWANNINSTYDWVFLKTLKQLAEEDNVLRTTFQCVLSAAASSGVEVTFEEWKLSTQASKVLFVIDDIHTTLNAAEILCVRKNIRDMENGPNFHVLATSNNSTTRSEILDLDTYRFYAFPTLNQTMVVNLACMYFEAYNQQWKGQRDTIDTKKAGNTIWEWCVESTLENHQITPFFICDTMCFIYVYCHFMYSNDKDSVEMSNKYFHVKMNEYKTNQEQQGLWKPKEQHGVIPGKYNQQSTSTTESKPHKIECNAEIILEKEGGQRKEDKKFYNDTKEKYTKEELRSFCRDLRKKLTALRAIQGFYPNSTTGKVTMDIKEGSKERVAEYIRDRCPDIWQKQAIEFVEQPSSPKYSLKPWTRITSSETKMANEKTKHGNFNHPDVNLDFATITCISKILNNNQENNNAVASETQGSELGQYAEGIYLTTVQHLFSSTPGEHKNKRSLIYTETDTGEGIIEVGDEYCGILGEYIPVSELSMVDIENADKHAVDAAILPVKKQAWDHINAHYQVTPTVFKIFRGDYEHIEKTDVQFSGAVTPNGVGRVETTEYYASFENKQYMDENIQDRYGGVLLVISKEPYSHAISKEGDSGALVTQCIDDGCAVGIISRIHPNYRGPHGPCDATLVFRLDSCFDALNQIHGIPVEMPFESVQGFLIGNKM